MLAQPVDVFRDCPLDRVLGAISHFFSDTGVVHVGGGPALWARVPAAARSAYPAIFLTTS